MRSSCAACSGPRYTAAIMFEKVWAKLHHAENWPEVQAIVRKVDQYELLRGRYQDISCRFAEITFAYTDPQQEHQYGVITVTDNSTLYDAKEDDFFSIRVNPEQPDQCYSPEATNDGR